MSDRPTDDIVEVHRDELYALYNYLEDATTAASTGDPNECARLAAEAKDRVMEMYENVE